MTQYVKVFPKDTCLEIAKVVRGPKSNKMNDDELLMYLSDNLFGRIWEVDSIAETIVVKIQCATEALKWQILPYFCEKIFMSEQNELGKPLF